MRLSQKAGLAAAMMSVAILGSLEQAGAIDLTGAWAISADECKNVFVRKGKANQITFAPMSEVHGGGFIVEPDRHRALQPPVRAERGQSGQDPVVVSADGGHGNLLLSVSDLTKLFHLEK
jgi:hypothetical protein